MIQEDYCSYEVAKLLKEKGFDIFKPYGWDEELFDKEHPRNFSLGFDSKEHWISCPTHQMAMKWLREVYKLSIEPYSIAIEENCIGYAYAICSCKTGLEIFAERWDGKNPFVSYEEAVESAVKYCLENLI